MTDFALNPFEHIQSFFEDPKHRKHSHQRVKQQN